MHYRVHSASGCNVDNYDICQRHARRIDLTGEEAFYHFAHLSPVVINKKYRTAGFLSLSLLLSLCHSRSLWQTNFSSQSVMELILQHDGSKATLH